MRKTLAVIIASLALVFTGAPVAMADPTPDPGPTPSECLPWTEPLVRWVDELRESFYQLDATYTHDVNALNGRVQDEIWENQALKFRIHTLRWDLGGDIRRLQRTVRHQRAEIRELRAELAAQD